MVEVGWFGDLVYLLAVSANKCIFVATRSLLPVDIWCHSIVHPYAHTLHSINDDQEREVC